MLNLVQFCDSMDCSPQSALFLWFPRQEYWSGCYFLLQGIFLTQGLNLDLLHWQANFLPLLHRGSTLLAATSVQFSSVAQSCLILCGPMYCSTPGCPVYHQLLELAQTHAHWISDAIQPSHPLSSPSPAFNLSKNHQPARVLEFQLQHQSFLWVFRTDFL